MAELKIFGEFEIEHLLAQQLFTITRTRDFLAAIGITKEMRGNKTALYANPDHVGNIQELSPSLTEALIEAGWGLAA